MSEEQMRAYTDLPWAESVRLIDFEQAEILTRKSFPPQFVLNVMETKPYLNTEVELISLVFVRQPEYWGNEVVERLRGRIGLPALVPYAVSTSLSGITGTEGIEAIGANRSVKIKVPPRETTDNRHNRSCWHDHQPLGPRTLHVQGKCELPAAGYSVELRRRELQGINSKDFLLDHVVHEPSGPVAQAVTVVEARYEEETDFEYDTVAILPDGVSVPVQEVH